MTAKTDVRPFYWNGDHLTLLDQRLLPHKTEYVKLETIEQVWDSIFQLQVRGAPAIGVTAAYGLALWAQRTDINELPAFRTAFSEKKNYLASARPTAVNLFWALARIENALEEATSVSVAKKLITEEAIAIEKEDEAVCRAIGEHALTLFKDQDTLLTHCNAGGIATARYGTALAPFYLSKEAGITLKAFACETRPVLQGARLTVWELQQLGIDVTLITDNMVAHTLSTKGINAVIVGADRIAANGDTANKIGTYGIALIANALNIPFYVAAPLSTIDIQTKTGDDIPIEERHADEVRTLNSGPTAPLDTKVFNPAFDVTPHTLITGIITEKGILTGHYEKAIAALF